MHEYKDGFNIELDGDCNVVSENGDAESDGETSSGGSGGGSSYTSNSASSS